MQICSRACAAGRRAAEPFFGLVQMPTHIATVLPCFFLPFFVLPFFPLPFLPASYLLPCQALLDCTKRCRLFVSAAMPCCTVMCSDLSLLQDLPLLDLHPERIIYASATLETLLSVAVAHILQCVAVLCRPCHNRLLPCHAMLCCAVLRHAPFCFRTCPCWTCTLTASRMLRTTLEKWWPPPLG
jgi:hypothetical protein